MKTTKALRIWVVYDHPKDHPDHFVARLFLNDRPTNAAIHSRNYEFIESRLMAEGLIKMTRHPSDDSCIKETWI